MAGGFAARLGVKSVIRAAGSGDNPPSGQSLIYPKSDGWYTRDSTGAEVKIGEVPAGSKVSELPAATLPLAGTEEVLVTQGGVSKRVAVDNMSEFYRAVLASNATSTSTTPAAISGLDLVLPAGTYNVKTWMVLQAAATTTGIGIHLNANGGTVTTIAATWYTLTTGTTATTGVMDQASVAATFQTMEGRAQRANNTSGGQFGGVDTANADQFAVLEGLVVVTAQTTLQHMMASEVASSQVLMKAGSNTRITKVA